jgi:hypothetical protein
MVGHFRCARPIWLTLADQDERLNLLSSSIGRQNHLSIQIGSELDLHHDLLEDTDAAMDRTAARLGRARRRLDTVAHEAKQYGALQALPLRQLDPPSFVSRLCSASRSHLQTSCHACFQSHR